MGYSHSRSPDRTFFYNYNKKIPERAHDAELSIQSNDRGGVACCYRSLTGKVTKKLQN
ncbi:MAG: hypothetical protein LH613_01185 [Chamaesiphon sp.]|nr:hypothetical protein [Chamaesiphon sp.]